VFGIFGTIFALMQFLFSPMLGVLSDQVGRRPVVLLSNLGLGLDYIVMAWRQRLAGSSSGASSRDHGREHYDGDRVCGRRGAAGKRAGAFGMIGAAFGVGFVLGPALGGLLGNSDPRLPFWSRAR